MLICYDELSEMLDLENKTPLSSPRLLVVDVRGPPELQQHGTIPGALNLYLRELEEMLDLSSKDFQERVRL